jgi:peptidoglycan/LPS O-acetylase OafA/YrhL
VSDSRSKLARGLAIASALIVFAAFWLLGDELDANQAEHQAWMLALGGSAIGVGGLLVGERRLKGRPLNWPLFLSMCAAAGGLLVVLFSFGPPT